MPTASVVRLQGHGRGARTDPRFTAAVAAVLDALPKHILTQLPRALAHLSLEERLALRLIVQEDHPSTVAAQVLGVSPKTLTRRVDAALQQLAELLWDSDGHAVAVQPPRR